MEPLVEALRAHKCITLEYLKENGEQVQHSGGITEIGVNKKGNQALWLFDTYLNDHIRQFLISNIQSFQVLDREYIDSFGWGFKLNGMLLV